MTKLDLRGLSSLGKASQAAQSSSMKKLQRVQGKWVEAKLDKRRAGGVQGADSLCEHHHREIRHVGGLDRGGSLPGFGECVRMFLFPFG